MVAELDLIKFIWTGSSFLFSCILRLDVINENSLTLDMWAFSLNKVIRMKKANFKL